jgi:hypothetical protein
MANIENPNKAAGSQPEMRAAQKPTEEPQESEYPPLLEYLQSKEGHELASRIVSIIEDVKKATIERSAEQQKLNAEFQHTTVRIWLLVQAGVFIVTIGVAAFLVWHDKLNPTIAAFMGTLVGYFLARPSRPLT